MCFAPQRRALFRHLKFQNLSETGVFCTFLLGNMLRATTACIFSTSQLPKVVRCDVGVSCTFWLGHVLRATTACTFSTSHLPKVVRCDVGVFCTFWLGNVLRATMVCNFWSLIWLRTRRFSEVTFRPSGAPNHWKNTVNCDYLFTHLHLLSSLIFSLLFLSSLTLPTSAFPTVHIVGSVTSKLPSIICYYVCFNFEIAPGKHHECVCSLVENPSPAFVHQRVVRRASLGAEFPTISYVVAGFISHQLPFNINIPLLLVK